MLLFVSCSSKEARNNKKSFYDNFYKRPYVISIKDSLIEHYYDSLSHSRKLPPPPSFPKTIRNFGMYYGEFNIVFCPNNQIFFHNKNYLFRDCWTGLRDNETDFLDIQPDDLIEVSPKSAIDIIQKNKKYS